MKRAGAPPAAAPLRLHIGALAISGVSRARGARIGAALQAELGRLIGTTYAIETLRAGSETGAVWSRPVVDGGQLRIDRGERPERVGRKLARQIADSLFAPPAPPRGAGR